MSEVDYRALCWDRAGRYEREIDGIAKELVGSGNVLEFDGTDNVTQFEQRLLWREAQIYFMSDEEIRAYYDSPPNPSELLTIMEDRPELALFLADIGGTFIGKKPSLDYGNRIVKMFESFDDEELKNKLVDLWLWRSPVFEDRLLASGQILQDMRDEMVEKLMGDYSVVSASLRVLSLNSAMARINGLFEGGKRWKNVVTLEFMPDNEELPVTTHSLEVARVSNPDMSEIECIESYNLQESKFVISLMDIESEVDGINVRDIPIYNELVLMWVDTITEEMQKLRALAESDPAKFEKAIRDTVKRFMEFNYEYPFAG